MPNAVELELLTGEADYRKGADFMIGMGVKIVAVKLGSKGCYVTDGKKSLAWNPSKLKQLTQQAQETLSTQVSSTA